MAKKFISAAFEVAHLFYGRGRIRLCRAAYSFNRIALVNRFA